MGTGSKRKLVRMAVLFLLLVVAGGGLVAGLPLSLFSRSLAHTYQGRDVVIAQAMTHPNENTTSFPTMSDACRPNDMPYLGLTYLPVTEAAARYFGLQNANGLLITAVASNSPSARAGLQVNDVLLQFDGYLLGPDSSMVSILMSYQIGDSVSLVVMRQDERKQVKLILGKRP